MASGNDERRRLLAIYLNDHLAGSAGGVALARRVAAAHGHDAHGAALARLAREIEEDRVTLRRTMNRLDIGETSYKQSLARVSEFAGRFKLNGRLLARSPLSDLVELEALEVAVQGKKSAWLALRDGTDAIDGVTAEELDALIGRADEQLTLVATLHSEVARRVFG